MKTVFTVSVLLLMTCTTLTLSQTTYYVNPAAGNDGWDGQSPTYVNGHHGPKASIQNAVLTAQANDIIDLSSDRYEESVSIDKALVINCDGPVSMEGLAITNTSEVKLNSSIQVTGVLSVANGKLVGSAQTTIEVTSTDPAAVVITGGRIVGKMLRNIAAYSTQPYPFTDAQTEVLPDGTQPQTGVFVQSFDIMAPCINPGQTAINRYYMIFFNGGSIRAALRLAYLESELNGIAESNLRPFRWNDGDTHWSEGSGTLHAAENYYQTSTVSLIGWSEWTLGDDVHPLPIQLASFTANVVSGNTVQLDWRTLTETNNYGFFIQQRTLPSEEYIDVPNSFVPGHGTTIEPHTYGWMIANVVPGSYYYRLKQIDLDGTVHLSDSREVIISALSGMAENQAAPATFTLEQNYPNPFNPSTHINFSVDRTGITTLTVFDILGHEVGSLFAGNAEAGRTYAVTFDAAQLPNGTYFYRLMNGNQTSLKKMVLLK